GLVEHLNVGLRGSDRHGTLLNERVRTPSISGRWVTGESGRRRRRTERRIARNKRRIAGNKSRIVGNKWRMGVRWGVGGWRRARPPGRGPRPMRTAERRPDPS